MVINKPKTLLSVRNLSKKFSKDIRLNLYYGFKDLLFDLLRIRNDYMVLRKKEFWAISDINLDLHEGEILGVIGGNGSGKTTLMRLISNIYPAGTGSVYIRKNQKITPIFALRAGMKPIFTGRENIYIKGAMYGMTKNEIEAKIEFIKSFSELGDELDKPLGNYSSGMGARLAFSIALATEPNIFIIDEALAVGDSVFKAKCYDYLKEYVKQPYKGVLFVSNNIRKILKVASRVIVMEKGAIVHNSLNVAGAIDFYVSSCLKGLDEKQRQEKLKSVREYDL